MGVSGCGKTSVGEKLAESQSWHFKDGDALHPDGNVRKMANGIPLTDEDRFPWLKLVGETLAREPEPTAVGCSALKRKYRDLIREAAGDDVCFIFLNGSRALIEERMSSREGHFMPLSLLDNQFTTLESPSNDENYIDIDIRGDMQSILNEIVSQLEARTS